MFKKSKIRKKFNEAYNQGNEQEIEQLLNEYPWLIEEWEAKQSGDSDSLVVLSALGVMEDELSGPAPIEEIGFCLRVDFQNKMDDSTINSYLEENRDLGYCKNAGNGWRLTSEGEKIVDNYLNAHAV